jgi:hypothetical protein
VLASLNLDEKPDENLIQNKDGQRRSDFNHLSLQDSNDHLATLKSLEKIKSETWFMFGFELKEVKN